MRKAFTKAAKLIGIFINVDMAKKQINRKIKCNFAGCLEREAEEGKTTPEIQNNSQGP